jgi:hypothetical protein
MHGYKQDVATGGATHTVPGNIIGDPQETVALWTLTPPLNHGETQYATGVPKAFQFVNRRTLECTKDASWEPLGNVNRTGYLGGQLM